MGLNVNVARQFLQQRIQANKNDKPENVEGEENIGGKTETKPQEPNPEDKITDNIVNTYTYFSIYEGITSRLGDFYAETLAKVKCPETFISKNFFGQLYNKTVRDIVNNALENAKSGNKPDFNELAQKVKDQITSELEGCNYDPVEYQKNQITNNINKNQPLFNE